MSYIPHPQVIEKSNGVERAFDKSLEAAIHGALDAVKEARGGVASVRPCRG